MFWSKLLQGWKEVRPRARMENLPSLYSRAHVGFCKRRCSIAEKEVSGLRLLIGLEERANVLRSWETGPWRIALGACCLILCCTLWEVRPTYRLIQWHRNWQTTLLWCEVGSTSFWAEGKNCLVVLGLPTVLYFKGQSFIWTPRPCSLLNLELSFISRAEKNLLQERKNFAKAQSNRGCVGLENRALSFFFFLETTMSTSSIFTWWSPKQKKTKRSTPDYPPGQEQRVSNWGLSFKIQDGWKL